MRLVGGFFFVELRDARDVVELEVLQLRHLGEARGGRGARAAASSATHLHRLAVVVALVVRRDALALALWGVDPVVADQRAEGLAVGARGASTVAAASLLAVLVLVDVTDAAVVGILFLSFWVCFSSFF